MWVSNWCRWRYLLDTRELKFSRNTNIYTSRMLPKKGKSKAMGRESFFSEVQTARMSGFDTPGSSVSSYFGDIDFLTPQVYTPRYIYTFSWIERGARGIPGTGADNLVTYASFARLTGHWLMGTVRKHVTWLLCLGFYQPGGESGCMCGKLLITVGSEPWNLRNTVLRSSLAWLKGC